MFRAYRRYFDFSGRARRSEYWTFYLGVLFTAVLLAFCNSLALRIVDLQAVNVLFLLLYVGLMLGSAVPFLAVTVRRIHDSDRSGWWVLLGLIPGVGALALLYFSICDGTPGPNRFGPPEPDLTRFTN